MGGNWYCKRLEVVKLWGKLGFNERLLHATQHNHETRTSHSPYIPDNGKFTVRNPNVFENHLIQVRLTGYIWFGRTFYSACIVWSTINTFQAYHMEFYYRLLEGGGEKGTYELWQILICLKRTSKIQFNVSMHVKIKYYTHIKYKYTWLLLYTFSHP